MFESSTWPAVDSAIATATATAPTCRLIVVPPEVAAPISGGVPEPVILIARPEPLLTAVVHVHVPGGMTTVSPSTARLIAFWTSSSLQLGALVIAAKVEDGEKKEIHDEAKASQPHATKLAFTIPPNRNARSPSSRLVCLLMPY